MGRGKIEIKKIENANSRQVTFSKRRTGLLKKAHELGVLCDAQVAVIIFSNTGKLFEFSSCSMQHILARYSKCLEPSQSPTDEDNPEEPKEEDILKKEIEALELKLLQLLGKDLTGLDLNQLKDLEQQLNESLLSVKKKKEQLLFEQLELSRIQEQRTLEENQTLRAQIAELKSLLPSTDFPPPAHGDYQPAESKGISVNAYPDRRSDYGVEHEDTNLRLGFLSSSDVKRKPTAAADFNVSGAQKRKRRTR